MRGQIEQIPAELLGVRERAVGEGLHENGSAAVAEVPLHLSSSDENAMAHFGRGGFGKGDGDDLAGTRPLRRAGAESGA